MINSCCCMTFHCQTTCLDLERIMARTSPPWVFVCWNISHDLTLFWKASNIIHKRICLYGNKFYWVVQSWTHFSFRHIYILIGLFNDELMLLYDFSLPDSMSRKQEWKKLELKKCYCGVEKLKNSNLRRNLRTKLVFILLKLILLSCL